jgi:hypothetical protein
MTSWPAWKTSSGKDTRRTDITYQLIGVARAPQAAKILYENWTEQDVVIRKNGNAALCLETTGKVWGHSGASFELPELYSRAKRIWPIVAQVAVDRYFLRHPYGSPNNSQYPEGP